MLALADGISISIGNNVWSFDLSFLLYLLIAGIVGIVAEYIVGWRVPLGIIGAIVAGVVGVWLMTRVIHIDNLPDLVLFNVPLIRALIGGIIFVGLWHLLTLGFSRRRHSRRAVE